MQPLLQRGASEGGGTKATEPSWAGVPERGRVHPVLWELSESVAGAADPQAMQGEPPRGGQAGERLLPWPEWHTDPETHHSPPHRDCRHPTGL